MSDCPPITDHPDPTTRWFHRRLQSYACLFGMACYYLAIVFWPSDALVAVAWPVMLSLSSIVASYHGFSVLESVKIAGAFGGKK